MTCVRCVDPIVAVPDHSVGVVADESTDAIVNETGTMTGDATSLQVSGTPERSRESRRARLPDASERVPPKDGREDFLMAPSGPVFYAADGNVGDT